MEKYRPGDDANTMEHTHPFPIKVLRNDRGKKGNVCMGIALLWRGNAIFCRLDAHKIRIDQKYFWEK